MVVFTTTPAAESIHKAGGGVPGKFYLSPGSGQYPITKLDDELLGVAKLEDLLVSGLLVAVCHGSRGY